MYVCGVKGSLVNFIAGILVLASVLLGHYVSGYFFIFTGFMGFMLSFSAITGFCPMLYILRAVGAEQREACKL